MERLKNFERVIKKLSNYELIKMYYGLAQESAFKNDEINDEKMFIVATEMESRMDK